jgi:hypothetical protein
MIATKKDVSENVLYLLLKQGMKYFKSDVGMETSVDIDIYQAFTYDMNIVLMTQTKMEVVVKQCRSNFLEDINGYTWFAL